MGAGKNAGFLLPFQTSTQQISTGRWSLSSRSNVPYVQLLGKGVNKTFTWGEVVEVPEGEICALRNASYHAGDVWLNNGWDFDNRPARITVPVPFTRVLTAAIRGVAYPADTRQARRAYFFLGAKVDDDAPFNETFYRTGTMQDGSMNTQDMVATSIFTGHGTGFNEGLLFGPGTYVGLQPLGLYSVLNTLEPHLLLTTSFAFMTLTNTSPQTPGGIALSDYPAYYVLEY